MLIVSRRLARTGRRQTLGSGCSARARKSPITITCYRISPSACNRPRAYAPTISVLELYDVPIGPYAVGRNVVGNSENFRGDIAEVLVYDRPFASLAERQAGV